MGNLSDSQEDTKLCGAFLKIYISNQIWFFNCTERLSLHFGPMVIFTVFK